MSTMTFASTRIQSSICNSFAAPTILTPAPNSTSKDPTTSVSGVGEPGITISVIENGVVVGTTIVGTDGSYAIEVPFVDGANTISVRGTDGCGISEDSASLLVTYVAPSTPPSQPSTPTGSQQTQTTTVPSEPFTPTPVARPLGQPAPSAPSTPGYPKPSILRPADGSTFSVNRIWVVGHATVGGIVTVYVNGHSSARVDVSSAGTFAVLIELQAGRNTIRAAAQEGSQTATSDTVHVTFVTIPAQSSPDTTMSVTTRIEIATTAAAIAALATVLGIRKMHYARRKK